VRLVAAAHLEREEAVSELDPDIWIAPFFRWDEFRCNDGTAVPARLRVPVSNLVNNTLARVRSIWGRPMTVLSGYRTPAWNKRVGGELRSYHLRGMAADIVIAGVRPMDVADAIQDAMECGTIPNGGLGRYRTFTHVDIGPARRWRG
jgi:uncharacterized protein YcbK (DUF882 family)